jgi:hypothetical protein
MHLTPFLTLVLAGYAVFMGTLGTYWLRQVVDEMRTPRKGRDER